MIGVFILSTLIIIRGNSGSGKTTTAKELQYYLGKGTMLLSQDVIRREVLRVNDGPENLCISLIQQMAEYGAVNCNYVIIEGIFYTKWYRDMFQNLSKNFSNVFPYYYDLSFEETLIRHSKRDKINEFGEKEMRSWWNEKDYLNFKNEKHLSKNLSSQKILEQIITDIKNEK